MVIAAVCVIAALVICIVPQLLGGGGVASPGLVVLAAGLALVAFLALGCLLAAVVTGPQAAVGVGNAVSVLTWLAAGMWFPRAAFPDWLRAITDATPRGAAARLMNEAAVGGTVAPGPVLVCLGWAVGAALLAVALFRWE